jgi:hypothetical protein
VVEHTHQRGEENDGRQYLAGEDEAESVDVHQAAEDEPAAFVDEAQHLHEAVADGIEHVLAARDEQHHRRERNLQANTGGDQLPVDAAFVVGGQPRDANEHRQAEETKEHPCKGFHSVLPYANAGCDVVVVRKLPLRSAR